MIPACRRAVVSALSVGIAHRELKVLRDGFALDEHALVAEEVPSPRGPGNAAFLEVECAHVTEVFTAVGEKATPAETVARAVVDEAQASLHHGQPVGEHLADQLLAPMSLAPGSVFRTGRLSSHTRTNLEGVARFIPLSQRVAELPGGGVEIALG